MKPKTEIPAVYLTKINVPGHLPEDDDLAAFDTAYEAWRFLASEREYEEDGSPCRACDSSGTRPDGTECPNMPYCTGTYSDTHASLVQLGDAIESQPGTVYGGTPGYDGDHDLGMAYSVVRIEHRDYPHYPGYLTGCDACEAKCHCEADKTECVFEGEHHLPE